MYPYDRNYNERDERRNENNPYGRSGYGSDYESRGGREGYGSRYPGMGNRGGDRDRYEYRDRYEDSYGGRGRWEDRDEDRNFFERVGDRISNTWDRITGHREEDFDRDRDNLRGRMETRRYDREGTYGDYGSSYRGRGREMDENWRGGTGAQYGGGSQYGGGQYGGQWGGTQGYGGQQGRQWGGTQGAYGGQQGGRQSWGSQNRDRGSWYGTESRGQTGNRWGEGRGSERMRSPFDYGYDNDRY